MRSSTSSTEKPRPASARPALRGSSTTLPWEWAEERLADAWNYWLATTSASRGPHTRPIWGVWCSAGLLFTTSPGSRKARDFSADPRVSVHAELVREVVVVDGLVVEAAPSSRDLEAYAEKYRWTPPPEAQRWYAVSPRSAYAAREDTFPEGATAFRFAS